MIRPWAEKVPFRLHNIHYLRKPSEWDLRPWDNKNQSSSIFQGETDLPCVSSAEKAFVHVALRVQNYHKFSLRKGALLPMTGSDIFRSPDLANLGGEARPARFRSTMSSTAFLLTTVRCSSSHRKPAYQRFPHNNEENDDDDHRSSQRADVRVMRGLDFGTERLSGSPILLNTVNPKSRVDPNRRNKNAEWR